MAKPEEKKRGIKTELAGVFFLTLALLSALSLIFYHAGVDPTQGVGLLGNNITWMMFAGIGYSAYFFPLLLFFLSFVFLIRHGEGFNIAKALSLVLFFTASCAIFSFIFDGAVAGGVFGELIERNLAGYVGKAGGIIIFSAVFLVSLRIGTGLPVIQIFDKTARALWFVTKGVYGAGRFFGKKAAELKKEEIEAEKPKKQAKEKPETEEAAKEPVQEKKAEKRAPNIVTLEQEKSKKKKAEPVQEELGFTQSTGGAYQLPSTTLLEAPEKEQAAADKEVLLTNSKILEKKLKDFDVDGSVVEVRFGPVVTTYEFEPAPGVKVNKIVNLADDLALALRAHSIRILAPIPGKAVVGVEVPNVSKSSITLREILEGQDFKKNKSRLSLALGKDISGEHYVADLAKMPHLLVAGATGSGKSVSVNVMILSILFKATPEEVRFLMVDPKMLELSIYDGIPHLLKPVITDVKRANTMLRGAVVEMERRYKLMSELGAKNIEGYNALVAEKPGHSDTDHKKLPFIVVVIDELADLMMVAGKDVEDSLVRLSQMARAAGIHLLVATQRPSVDVITGLIKANFPARISFQVPSKTDSRTILDAGGAEALLGQGDMLFMPPGAGKLLRLHGCYVSEKDIKKVTDFLKKQGKPVYHDEIMDEKTVERIAEAEDLGEEFMAKYMEAVEMAQKMEMISTSYIQRRFRIGYNTAARIIEKMEQDGVVGPAQGSKPREVIKRGIGE
ncbi:MAG: DNA translocase FtsK 4TM domain-containing protein [Deltaproteobacteria bacterium]|nr:DNA translocase FtsK 4TM domain-containing protein [Deltaproteobacteria bacterium]